MRLGGIVFDPRSEVADSVEVGPETPSAVKVQRNAVQRLWQLRVEIAYEHARSDLRRRCLALAELLLDRVDEDGLAQITSRSVAARIGGGQKSGSVLLDRLCDAGLMTRLDDVVDNDIDGGYTGLVRLYRMWGQSTAVRTPLYFGCKQTHPSSPLITGEPMPAVPASKRDVVREASAALRAQVLSRDGACLACGSRCCLVADHIVPWSAGGRTTLANLQTLCRVCNTAKGTAMISFVEGAPALGPYVTGVSAGVINSHGSSGYRRGCRCPICKAVAKGYRDRYRSKHKKPERVYADPLPGLPQHNASSYAYYKCRCQECCVDKAKQAKAWRDARLSK